MPTTNEAIACTVTALFLCETEQKSVEEVCRPDQQQPAVGSQPPAVECVYRCGSKIFVVEHTIIESFPQQKADNQWFDDFMSALCNELEAEIDSLIPSGRLLISVPARALAGLKRQQYNDVRARVAAWVRQRAGGLSVPSDRSGSHELTEQPPGVTFPVTIARYASTLRVVRPAREIGSDLEAQRATRLKTALDKKLPKLQQAKTQHGGESVLILEQDDIALGNVGAVSDALDVAIAQSPHPASD